MKRYFEMLQDMSIADRWYLTNPVDRHGTEVGSLLWDGQLLTLEEPVRVQRSPFAKVGRPIDYCELDGISGIAPVVHIKVAMLFRQLATSDVQLIAAEVDGVPEQYYIVNVVRICKCVDEKASRYVERYTEADAPVFADRIGEYKSIRGLRIDKSKVGDAQIFRIWGWHQSLVVSEEVKAGMERVRTVGVRFEEV